jgi:hypothetical protein
MSKPSTATLKAKQTLRGGQRSHRMHTLVRSNCRIAAIASTRGLLLARDVSFLQRQVNLPSDLLPELFSDVPCELPPDTQLVRFPSPSWNDIPTWNGCFFFSHLCPHCFFVALNRSHVSTGIDSKNGAAPARSWNCLPLP